MGCKDVDIRNSEFVAKTQFLFLQIQSNLGLIFSDDENSVDKDRDNNSGHSGNILLYTLTCLKTI